MLSEITPKIITSKDWHRKE